MTVTQSMETAATLPDMWSTDTPAQAEEEMILMYAGKTEGTELL